MGHGDRGDAGRGIISRRGFGRLHVLMAPRGMIAARGAAAGRRHGPPVLGEMYGRIPRGSGRVILDAAYLAKANCDEIARSGRTPVICPRSNSKPNGFYAMGKMPGWRRDDPGGFARAYHRRSLAGTAFPVTREGSGAVARAGTPAVRKLQLVPKCIRCSLVAQALRPVAGRAQRMLRAKRRSFQCRPPGRGENCGVPASRTHQNVHKSGAENCGLDSAAALLVRSGVSSLFGSCLQLDTQAW